MTQKITFTILFVTFSLNQVLRITLFGNAAVTGMDVAVILLFLHWILRSSIDRTLVDQLRRTEVKLMGIFFLCCTISLLINPLLLSSEALVASSLYLFRFVLYSSLMLIMLHKSHENNKFVTRGMITSGVAIVGIGFLQYIFYQDLRNLYYLGWDEHLYRLFSVFLDPNFASVYYALFFLFLLGYAYTRQRNKERYTYFILAFFTLIALALTHSRTGIIALSAGSFVFFALVGRLKALLFLVGFFAVFFLVFSQYFHLENVNPFRTASSNARITSFKRGQKIFQDHILFGVGFNTYEYAQEKYHFIDKKSRFPSHSAAGTDTSFLFLLATTGIVGTGSFLCFWSFLLRRVVKNRGKVKTFAAVFISSIVTLVVGSFFLNTLFYPSFLLWIWLLYPSTEKT